MSIIRVHEADSRIKLRCYRTRQAWVVRIMVRGHRQELVTLRAAPSDPAAALLEGRAIIALAEAGVSPLEQRRAQDAEARAHADKRVRAAMTFGQAVERFLSGPEVAGLRRRSANDLAWALRSSHVAHLGSRRLVDVRLAVLEGVVAGLADRPSTARKVGGAIRRLLRWAERHEWIERAPSVRLPAPRTRAEPLLTTGERSDWSVLVKTLAALDEYERLHPGTVYPAMHRVQALTGLRPEAVERLERRDVNLTARTVTIRAEVSKLKRQLVVPVSKACAAELQRVMGARDTFWTQAQRDSLLVFPGRSGKPLSKNEALAAFVDGRVGTGHYRPARWRSTFVSWCQWRGVPYAVVARLVDWKAEGRMVHYSQQGVLESDRDVVERWAKDVAAAAAAAARRRKS